MHFLLGLLASLLIVGDASKLSNLQRSNNDVRYMNGRLDVLDDLIALELANLNSDSKSLAFLDDFDENHDERIISSNVILPEPDEFSMEKKSARLRTMGQRQDDRGNRDMENKFNTSMVQCHERSQNVNLAEKFGKQSDRVEFHEHYYHFQEVECVRVGERDHNRVRYPCKELPRPNQRLCYLAGTECETLYKRRIVWMRDRYDDGKYNEWYPETRDFKVGCHCNYEFHH